MMWILTLTGDLLNMDFVKRIECDDGGQIVATMDDGRVFLIAEPKDVDEHIKIIRSFCNDIIDAGMMMSEVKKDD